LQVIMGSLETLKHRVEEPGGLSRADILRAVDAAMRGADRAASLTQRLLAFSRRQSLNPRPVEVNRLVTGMSELLRRTLGETIVVETVLGGGLWRISADPNQLESAILNLAVNARDAMPNGGKLTIETANAFLDEAYAREQQEVQPGQYVMLAISDTGLGMTKEVMASAFDPFFTTKEPGQGTGLGLSQVYGFVKQSNGHVTLYSEVGSGTTVRIYLPRLVGEAQTEEGTLQLPPPVGRESEIILVVEDDEAVREVSSGMLRQLGYAVVEAQDGATALKLLHSLSNVRVLFTDVGLPGNLNGRQLADLAVQARPGLRVLFTTGYARNAIVHSWSPRPRHRAVAETVYAVGACGEGPGGAGQGTTIEMTGSEAVLSVGSPVTSGCSGADSLGSISTPRMALSAPSATPVTVPKCRLLKPGVQSDSCGFGLGSNTLRLSAWGFFAQSNRAHEPARR
jgi:CheY-like chemotaxis protein